MRTLQAVLLGAALLAGCVPEERDGSVQALVYAYDEESGQYGLRFEPVEHLVSLRELRGRDVELRAHGEIYIGQKASDLEMSTGEPFAFDYALDDGGAVIPADLHSAHALTIYRNLDRAAALLRQVGFVPRQPLPVLYFPRTEQRYMGDLRDVFVDNAAFFAFGAVLVMPSYRLDQLPLHLNEGVLAHEYGHSVVMQELFDNSIDRMVQEGSRDVDAMNEAFADLTGFAASGDTDYVGHAIPGYQGRDLAAPLNLEPKDLQAMEEEDGDFDPHYAGAILAKAVYELWPKGADGRIARAERERMMAVVLAALREMNRPGNALGALADATVGALPAEERQDACRVFQERLAPLADSFTECEAP